MKKIILIIAAVSAFLSFNTLYSQSLELVRPESSPDTVNGEPETFQITAVAEIENVSDAELNFKISTTVIQLAEGHLYSFCDLNTCYQPQTGNFTTPNPSTLAAGESTEKHLYLDLHPEGNDGTSIISVRYFNVDNPDDFVEYTVVYIVGTIGVDEIIASLKPLVYPNPASERVTIKNKTPFKNNTLKIFDASGRIVKQINRLNGESINVAINDLSIGVYNFVIFNGNKLERKGKFIISR